MNWYSPAVTRLITLGLQEDGAKEDVTTRLLVPATLRMKAVLIAKQKGVVAGLPMAGLFFKRIDSRCRFLIKKRDGRKVMPGDVLAFIEGPAQSILVGERPALNALQHLSGIATYTAALVAKLKGRRTRLYDTRKTLPGWRALEKYAVKCGGGENHRLSLAEAILVKDNHLMISRQCGLDWIGLLQKVQRAKPNLPIQVEAQSWQDLREILTLKPKRVLLDNLPYAVLKRMIAILRAELSGTEIEISGGIKPSDLKPLSRLGADRISMGKLTHSAPAFDCSLDILHVHKT